MPTADKNPAPPHLVPGVVARPRPSLADVIPNGHPQAEKIAKVYGLTDASVTIEGTNAEGRRATFSAPLADLGPNGVTLVEVHPVTQGDRLLVLSPAPAVHYVAITARVLPDDAGRLYTITVDPAEQ